MKKMNKVLALLTAGALMFGCMFTSCSNGSSGDESGNGSGSGGTGGGYPGKVQRPDNEYVFYGPDRMSSDGSGVVTRTQFTYTYTTQPDGNFQLVILEKYSGEKTTETGHYTLKGSILQVGGLRNGATYTQLYLIGNNHVLRELTDTKYTFTLTDNKGNSVDYDFYANANLSFKITYKDKTSKLSSGTYYIDGSTIITTNQDGEIIAYTIGENDTLTMIIPPEEEKPAEPKDYQVSWSFYSKPEGLERNVLTQVKDLEFPALIDDAIATDTYFINGGTLKATGTWQFNYDRIETPLVPGATINDAKNWTSRTDTSYLTLTLTKDISEGHFEILAFDFNRDRNSFFAVLNSNNEIVFGVSYLVDMSHDDRYKKLDLTAGTYTIAMNGAAIHYFDGKVKE
jgi:antitoxin component YwqK of YwqJK toxin-antitoxin module